jgi:hypothetical protein
MWAREVNMRRDGSFTIRGVVTIICALFALALTACASGASGSPSTANAHPTSTPFSTVASSATATPTTAIPIPTPVIDPAPCAAPTPAPQPPLASPPPITASGWAIYTNTAYHYSIQYPANWEARDLADTTNSSFRVNNSHGLLGGSGPYPAYPLNLISVEAVANTAQLSAADFVTNRQRNAGPSDTPICSQETHAVTVARRAAIELVQHPIQWNNGLIDFPATTYFVPDGTAILILSEVHSPGGQPSDVFTHMLASLTITS